MKINYEKLKEVLKPYDLYVEDNIIKGLSREGEEIEYVNFDDIYAKEIIEDIKTNALTDDWVSTVRVLIPILHPHYNNIFQPTINKEKLIEVFKKYGGWEVDGNDLYIPQNNTGEINYYNVDILIRKYTLRDCTNPGQDVILSFMHHYEDEFVE